MDGVSSAQRWTRAMNIFLFLSLLPWIPKKTREGSSSELLDVAGVNIGRISIRIGQNNLSKHAGKKSGSIIEDKSFRSPNLQVNGTIPAFATSKMAKFCRYLGFILAFGPLVYPIWGGSSSSLATRPGSGTIRLRSKC